MADAIQTLIAELRDYKQSENAQRIRATVETMVAAFNQIDVAVGGIVNPGLTYATGVWTPVDASGAGLVFSGAGGTWTNIGNMVFYNAILQYPATASALAAKIGGLPFPSGSNRTPSLALVSGGPDVSIQPLAGTITAQLLSLTTDAPVTNATLTGQFVTLNGAYSLV